MNERSTASSDDAPREPYRPVAGPLSDPVAPFDDDEKAELLVQYRSRIFALGVFWTLIAFYDFAGAFAALAIPREVPLEQHGEWYAAAQTSATWGAIQLLIAVLACRYYVLSVFAGFALTGWGLYNVATGLPSVFDVELRHVLLPAIEVGQSIRVLLVAWPLFCAGVPLRSDPAAFRSDSAGSLDADDSSEDEDDVAWESDPDHPAWK
ncbi:MAG TPA: hypothetical protein VGE52_20565 [Pirellulales bacterium]